jgi:hypothetical protein
VRASQDETEQQQTPELTESSAHGLDGTDVVASEVHRIIAEPSGDDVGDNAEYFNDNIDLMLKEWQSDVVLARGQVDGSVDTPSVLRRSRHVPPQNELLQQQEEDKAFGFDEDANYDQAGADETRRSGFGMPSAGYSHGSSNHHDEHLGNVAQAVEVVAFEDSDDDHELNDDHDDDNAVLGNDLSVDETTEHGDGVDKGGDVIDEEIDAIEEDVVNQYFGAQDDGGEAAHSSSREDSGGDDAAEEPTDDIPDAEGAASNGWTQHPARSSHDDVRDFGDVTTDFGAAPFLQAVQDSSELRDEENSSQSDDQVGIEGTDHSGSLLDNSQLEAGTNVPVSLQEPSTSVRASANSRPPTSRESLRVSSSLLSIGGQDMVDKADDVVSQSTGSLPTPPLRKSVSSRPTSAGSLRMTSDAIDHNRSSQDSEGTFDITATAPLPPLIPAEEVEVSMAGARRSQSSQSMSLIRSFEKAQQEQQLQHERTLKESRSGTRNSGAMVFEVDETIRRLRQQFHQAKRDIEIKSQAEMVSNSV